MKYSYNAGMSLVVVYLWGMAREIKFRYWDEALKHMFYSDNQDDAKKLGVKLGGSLISALFNAFYGLDGVEQYAGLKDKNNVHIFEGDIVKSFSIDDGELIDIVTFSNGQFVLSNPNKLSWPLGDYKSDYIEVIGNIHQNYSL